MLNTSLIDWGKTVHTDLLSDEVDEQVKGPLFRCFGVIDYPALRPFFLLSTSHPSVRVIAPFEADTMFKDTYEPGDRIVLCLRSRAGSIASAPLETPSTTNLTVQVIQCFKPCTMAVVCRVRPLYNHLTHNKNLHLPPECILKLYDWRIAPGIRTRNRSNRGSDQHPIDRDTVRDIPPTKLYWSALTSGKNGHGLGCRGLRRTSSETSLDKIYLDDRCERMMSREATTYIRLKDLWGIAIPSFLGCVSLSSHHTHLRTAQPHPDQLAIDMPPRPTPHSLFDDFDFDLTRPYIRTDLTTHHVPLGPCVDPRSKPGPTSVSSPGILLEYIPGITLTDYIHSRSRADLGHSQVRRVCNKAVKVVNRISDHGVLNLDVRLDNLLVTHPIKREFPVSPLPRPCHQSQNPVRGN